MIPAIPFEEPGDLGQYTVDELHAIIEAYQQEMVAAATCIDLWERSARLTLDYLRRLGLDKVADAIERRAHYMRVWKTGDAVEIEFERKTLPGTVLLASQNGRSLMLSFDGMLGGYAGMMPVLEEDGVFRDLITRSCVSLTEPKEE